MTRVLLNGRGLLESIRWREGGLYVSDWSAGEVLAVPGGVLATVESLPLCFDWLPDGRLVLVDSAAGVLPGREPDGTLFPHAPLGSPGWDDIAVDGRGHVYVNRPDFTGPTGTIHLAGQGEVAGGLAFPNGMAVTGDTLIVAESHGHRLTAFAIGPDGGLSGRRVWAPLDEAAAPDGICVDAEGAVWYADVPNKASFRARGQPGQPARPTVMDRALGSGRGRWRWFVLWLGWVRGLGCREAAQ